MFTPRQLLRRSMQHKPPYCHWSFRPERTEDHSRPGRKLLPHSLIKKGTKRARNAPFSRPRWFRQNSPHSFGMNGGDDETRTRDLCRDSQRPEVTGCNFTAPIATLGALRNPREVLLHPNCTQIRRFSALVIGSYFDTSGVGAIRFRMPFSPRPRMIS